MSVLLFAASVIVLMAGHWIKILRWSRLITTYEQPPRSLLMRAMGIGYAFNFLLPFKLGEIIRAYYAGRRMKNGIGLSLATIIIDRFLDILAVTIIFALLWLLGIKRKLVLDTAGFYFLATAVVIICLMLVSIFSSQIKRATMCVCSIFNDKLKLSCEKFVWALINAFRDIRGIKTGVIVMQTVLMWALYIISYALLAMFMARQGSNYSLTEIMITLFSRSSLDLSALNSAFTSSALLHEQFIIIIYTLLPPLILFLLPTSKAFRNAEAQSSSEDMQFFNMLPQIDEKDQLNFLDDYFSARRPELLKKFIAINRDISIIADYSSGSNASTILCMDKDNIFYRKYAFGSDGDKLYEQLKWLREHQASLPLCAIIKDDHNEDYCCYDMEYKSDAVGMFQFIHSHPSQESRKVLLDVLEAMNEGLYTLNSRPADTETTERYISQKVISNLDILKASRELHELLEYEKLTINYREYLNAPILELLFNPEHLKGVFAQDSYCDIHGDLTIENIICTGNDEIGFYIIDPNTGNVHDSRFLDYAKLLQSLHGGYEFMTKTSSVSVNKDNINFVYTRSTAYDELFAALREYLDEHFSPAEVRSIFYHELVHWLRLLPYKLRKDPKRAPMFYAGLVMVANDVYNWFEKK